jgi:hypothetical protein
VLDFILNRGIEEKYTFNDIEVLAASLAQKQQYFQDSLFVKNLAN